MSDAARGPKADKIWSNALRIAVLRESEERDQNGKKRNYLSIIARNMVHKAADGDVAAMKEIGDRLDGKAHQSSDTTVNASDSLAELLAAVSQNGKLVGHE